MCDRIPCFEEDLAYIKDSLKSFKDDSYSFTRDLQVRMDELHLSSSTLAKRCHVSHAAIYKWRSGKALPKGRERLKNLEWRWPWTRLL